MVRKPLSEAQLAQRRAAAKHAGRPAAVGSFSSARRRIARLNVDRARTLIQGTQLEVAETLIAGMRGQLPNSTADTMVRCAVALANKGGMPDVAAQLTLNPEEARKLNLGVNLGPYAEAIANAEPKAEAHGDAVAH